MPSTVSRSCNHLRKKLDFGLSLCPIFGFKCAEPFFVVDLKFNDDDDSVFEIYMNRTRLGLHKNSCTCLQILYCSKQ